MRASSSEPGGAGLPADLDRLLHDLRGPLNSAVMHLEVLKRASPEDPTTQQSLETIQQELARLARMLPAAFEVLALERGEVVPVELRAMVERTLAEHGWSGVTLEGGAWPAVRGDPRLLGLAVAHLVKNALVASEGVGDAPPPHVGVEAGPGTVTLVVRDWGPGLRSTNPRVAIRLASSPRPGHPGVGLVTVERIARLHGGRLALDTPAGAGAEVRLTLPAG